MIDKVTEQRIKDTADIVDVVGDYVHLVRRGANYMGLCPFHNERTPSFSVNKARNFCYCFSCKKGGSPVNFIMEKEGLSYHEALLHLARRYGIPVEERELTDEERAAQSAREAMLVANEWAMKRMEEDLNSTEEGNDVGLQYIIGRGITERARKAFHLGYALDRGNHLAEAARKAGFNLDILKELGLLGTSQEGRIYDRFRGRVIFPILNTSGKVIAFGGRDLKGKAAKYINSPESPLYKKSNELYGMYQARNAIVKEGKCFLVEGYMDVIGMWQSGMENVVASSGTALTDGQIALIHRFTEQVTLIYDGDEAGIKAALRGIDMLLAHKLRVNVLLLPPDEDPDSFARKHTPEEFRRYVNDNETDIIRFKAKVLLERSGGSPQGRIAAVSSVVESIAHIPDAVSRDIYIQECASILGVGEETVAKAAAQARARLSDQWKRERERRAIDNIPPGPSSPPQASVAHPSPSVATSPEIASRPAYPLRPLERAVIKYCVRYAYLPFCQIEEGSDDTMSVLQFVESEMKESDISFTCPDHAHIFRELLLNTPAFEEAYSKGAIEIENSIEEMRRQRIAEIADKNPTIAEIKKEESIMEADLEKQRDRMLSEFIKNYSQRLLSNHCDDDIRRTSTALIYEPHRLSAIYSRDNAVATEEDNLFSLLLRAIEEWKTEIINLRLQDLMKQFRDLSGKDNTEKEQDIQMQIAALMRTRAEMARNIGERVICLKKN